MRTPILFSLAALAAAGCGALIVACSSSSKGTGSMTPEDGGGDGGACAQFTDNADLTSPTVSFKNDVLPIFQFSCGSASCHGGGQMEDIGDRGLFLGCSAADISMSECSYTGAPPNITMSTDESGVVYMGLVGPGPNTPIEESCMPYVMAGEPTKSYLMHKIDGDQGCTVSCCTSGNAAVMAEEGMSGPVPANGWCGDSMPYGNPLIPAGPVCGGSPDCASDAGAYARDTIRAWIAQGAMNN
jgi:hypothetical protein